MQLTFEFLRETVSKWQDLDEAARAECMDKLARLIARAAVPDQGKEENHDD